VGLLPRTIWLGGIVGLVGIIALGVFLLGPKNDDLSLGTIVVENTELLNQAFSSGLKDTDADNDGLRDWEENLWGTDPHNADTDGDGTSDGEEVDRDRNPVKAGPNDDLSSRIVDENSSSEELTATDAFSREFFTDYLVLRKSGNLDSTSAQNLLLAGTLEKEKVTFTEDLLTREDIHINSVTTVESLHQYGNIMGNIIELYSVKNRNEAVILLDALQTEDVKKLNELVPIQESYASMRKSAQEILVPEGVADAHLSLLNSFFRIEMTIVAMRKIFEDPLQSISAIATYQNNSTKLALSLIAINDIFKNEGVVFNSSESGYFFPSLFKK